MDVHTLKQKQVEFLEEIENFQKSFSECEKLRKRFIKKFPEEKILNLTLEEYIIGKGSTNSFCYWLETTLISLGKIKGGSTAGNKFGVYFGKLGDDSNKKYRSIGKWGSNPDVAFINIKKEIFNLIKFGKEKEIDKLIENKISPMFKGKILSTYYPEQYLSVFSPDHLDYFINLFNLTFNKLKNMDPIEKRELLIKYKNSDSVMNEWSLFMFEKFLYSKFHPKASSSSPFSKKVPEELKEYVEDIYPELSSVNPLFVDSEIDEIETNNGVRKINSGSEYGKTDFEKQNKRNYIQGNKAEVYVIKAEKKYLEKIGKKDLANKIEHTSLKIDNKGYDILSFDEKGNQKYIEVKSTKNKFGDANFLISSNEINKSKLLNNYYIYVVFEVNTSEPKIWRINNPFVNDANKIKITPISFRVEIKSK